MEAEETVEESETSKPDEEHEEEVDVEELKKRADLAENYKKRAEIAETENKKLKKKPDLSSEGLSSKDVLALAKSDIASEDIDEVVEFAKFKKISVTEALGNVTIKNILADRAEERRTAAATQVKSARGGSAKVSGEDLLAKAEKTGEVPDTEEGLQSLFLARLARKFPSKK